MNLWKKMRVIVFIGLGIFAVSASGERDREKETEERKARIRELLNHPKVLEGMTRHLEWKFDSVSKISDFSIRLSETPEITAHFTVTTTDGDVLEDFQCLVSFGNTAIILTLENCGNAVARLDEDVLFSIETLSRYPNADFRRSLK